MRKDEGKKTGGDAFIWAWFGMVVRQWLTSHLRYRVFNIAMAVLLVGSLYPVLKF